MSKKYEFTGETKPYHGGAITLHQIRAVADFGSVKTGDIGGWIEFEANLPNTTDDKSWVWPSSIVTGTSRVYDSIIGSDSTLFDTIVSNNSELYKTVVLKSNISESKLIQSTAVRSTIQKIKAISSNLDKCICGTCRGTTDISNSRLFNCVIANTSIISDAYRTNAVIAEIVPDDR